MSLLSSIVFAALAAGHAATAQSLRGMAMDRGVNASTAAGCTPGDNAFDNLLLVEQWPGTVGVSAPSGGFTMHGLWPSRVGANIANYPCQCTNQAFDVSLLSSIMTELNTWWPSSDGSNPTFWSHEFEKHGTCAEAISSLETELLFFTGALNLRATQNSYGLLQSASITPSSSQTYTLSQLQQAFPTVAIFKCTTSNQLQEVATCFDKNLNAIDCESDAYGGSSCSGGISIPPVSSSSPLEKAAVDGTLSVRLPLVKPL
jgi:ribonuclease T2